MKKRKKQLGLFLKDGKYQIYVPGRVGLRQRSTGTGDLQLARRIKNSVRDLKDRQDWLLLDAAYCGKLSLPDLFAAYASNSLDSLRASIGSPDLSEHLPAWCDWVTSSGGTPLTGSTYRAQVDTLIKPGFRAHQLVLPRVSEWLAGIPNITTGTRRKYLYALRSFIRFLIERGVLNADPSAGVKSPKKNKPRLRYELEATDIRIVEAAPQPYKALFALIKSTGAEVSAALATLRSDLDLNQALVHIRGTKNENRDRHDAIIEPWGLPYLREHCRTIVGNAMLWPGISRYQAHAFINRLARRLV